MKKHFESCPKKEHLAIAAMMHAFLNEEKYREALEEAKDTLRDKKKPTNQMMCVIQTFLNAWNCRISDDVSNEIKEKLEENWEKIVSLKSLSLERLNEENKKEINKLFDTLIDITGVHITVASKVLHILLPNLITMTDKEIEKVASREIENENGEKYTYFDFQKKMWEWAKEIDWGYFKKILRPLDIEYWTVLKLIDAYNWITITRGIEVEKVLSSMSIILSNKTKKGVNND